MPEPISRPSPKLRPSQPAERLGQLLAHLLLAGGAEVDAPLGVVLVGGGVVVAGVDVLDVLGRGGGGGRHRARNSTRIGVTHGAQPLNTVPAVDARVRPAEPARRGAAAAADRRADAARRARGELLVPAPPRRLRVDRGAGRRQARRRHGVRGGLRIERSGRRGGERRRRRRQPRGARARPAALRAPQPALRARPGRELRRALRRGRLPADDRARPGRRRDPRALQVDAGARRGRLRLDAEPADPGAARGREVRQPVARARVPRRGVPRALRGPLRRGSSCSASSTRASCAPTSSRSSLAGTPSTSASA